MSGLTKFCMACCLCLLTNQLIFAQEAKQYELDIEADFREAKHLTKDEDCIPIKISVRQKTNLLRELTWQPNPHQTRVRANEGLKKKGGKWHWLIPKKGGELRYCIQLTRLRGERYDSKVTKNWALFRADDLFPAVASVAVNGSYSRTRLKFKLPPNWSSVTPYPEINDNKYKIENPKRMLDRPTGWVQLGELGVRRDRIAKTRAAVSAPIGQEVTRLEILTLLTFTLPTLRDWFPEFPERLLVVSASDDMWRGALSGPASLFLHAERPLVSENGTSTVLHELVHVAMQREAALDADWIDEGLAEYLALVLLHEAGGLTDRRFRVALDDQRIWGESASQLEEINSRGAATAKAVTVFAQLHNKIGDKNFRQLVKKLADSGPAITPASLRSMAEEVSGLKLHNLPQ